MNVRTVAIFLVTLWNIGLGLLLTLAALMLWLLEIMPLASFSTLMLLAVASVCLIMAGAIALLDIFVYLYGFDSVVKVLTPKRSRSK